MSPNLLSSDAIQRQVNETTEPVRSSSSPGLKNSDSEPLVVQAPMTYNELLARLKDADPVLNEGDSILRAHLEAQEKHLRDLIKEARTNAVINAIPPGLSFKEELAAHQKNNIIRSKALEAPTCRYKDWAQNLSVEEQSVLKYSKRQLELIEEYVEQCLNC